MGQDSFGYFLTDDEGTAYATVTITVTAPNLPPQAVNNTYSTNEDTPLVVASAGVPTNDTDSEQDTLSAVIVAGTSHGNVTLDPGGGFTYTPASDYNGPDSFTYRAWDGHHFGNVATVSLSVTSLNDVPVATSDTFTIVGSMPRWIDILATDSDVEGNAISATNVTDPPHGSVTLYADGTIAYSPDAGYSGNDSFTYRVTDGQATSGIATAGWLGFAKHNPANHRATLTESQPPHLSPRSGPGNTAWDFGPRSA